MKRTAKQKAAMSHNSLIGLAVCIQRHAATITEGSFRATTRGQAEAIRTQAALLEQMLREEGKS